MNHDPTMLPPDDQGGTAPTEGTTAVARCRDNVMHSKKDSTERGSCSGILLVAHVGKLLLNFAATRLSSYCKAKKLLPEKSGLHLHRSMTDMMFAGRRLQELGRKARAPLFRRFLDLQNVYDPVDCTLFWQVRSVPAAVQRLLSCDTPRRTTEI